MVTERIYLKDYYPFLADDDCNPYADLYLPYNMAEMNRQNDHRPTVVVCPGGGYAMCSEREAEPIALQYLSMGFNAIVIYYSVAPKRYPHQLNEVAAVFELIHKNADKWNCDTEKIAITGFSAGGHLAAHYSNLWNDNMFKEHFEGLYKPYCSILCYPVISTINPHQGSFVNLLGHFPENDEEICRFSCEKLVGKQTPKAFIWHTAADNAVPVYNSLCYAEALATNDIPFELHIYPYGYHGLSTSDKLTCDNPKDTDIKYVNKWLKELKRWIDLNF